MGWATDPKIRKTQEANLAAGRQALAAKRAAGASQPPAARTKATAGSYTPPTSARSQPRAKPASKPATASRPRQPSRRAAQPPPPAKRGFFAGLFGGG
jgi:hypothetical protein